MVMWLQTIFSNIPLICLVARDCFTTFAMTGNWYYVEQKGCHCEAAGRGNLKFAENY